MSFLPIETIHAGQALPGALEAIAAGTLGGVLVEGVYDAAALAGINARIPSADLPRSILPGAAADADPPHILGRSIVDCPPDLTDYFAAAVRFRAGLPALFDGLPDICAQLEGVVSALGGRAAVAGEVQPYSPATIRHLPPGHGILLHIGNAFLTTPQSADLSQTVDVGAQLSYFVPLQIGA